jgi:phage virion morphogenesis protein
MPQPTLTVDDSRLRERIAALTKRGRDMSSAFAEISEMLVSSVEQNFQQEGRYSEPRSWQGGGRGWTDLKPATVAQRRKSGRGPHPILQVSGQLASSITGESGPRHATVGTNLAYAGVHQFGTDKAGRNKSTTIPARPFLVAQDEDLDDALDIIEQHLTREEA